MMMSVLQIAQEGGRSYCCVAHDLKREWIEEHSYFQHRCCEHPAEFTPVTMRTIKENDRHQTCARDAIGNKIIVATDISFSVILPKKNPVLHKHPAASRARIRRTRSCGSNIASNCRAGG